MKIYYYLFTLTVVFPLMGLAAQINTIYVPKFKCSPANKMVQSLSNQYILSNPSLPQLPASERVKIHKYFRVMNGPAVGKMGTIEELLKVPGIDPQSRIEQIARFAQFNSSVENSYRVFRSYFDPKVCNPTQSETCLWDDMINVYQDATISKDGTLAAVMSNGDGYTPDIAIIEIGTTRKTLIFTSGYQTPWDASGKVIGQVNFINDSKGMPRFISFRDGGYKISKISITYFDLVTKEQLTIPREQIENLIGIVPDPKYTNRVAMKTFYSVDIEKLFADVRSGVMATKAVMVPFKSEGRDLAECPSFQNIGFQ
ncbi:MAG: hypothetical protein AABY64_06460 [Bdellovibrionota bacterium]